MKNENLFLGELNQEELKSLSGGCGGNSNFRLNLWDIHINDDCPVGNGTMTIYDPTNCPFCPKQIW